MKLLGFKDFTLVDKKRKVYTYKNFEIVVDAVKGLGEFTEIELTDSDGSVPIKQEFQRIYDFLKQIGFKQIRSQQRGYVSMLWNLDKDFTKIKDL